MKKMYLMAFVAISAIALSSCSEDTKEPDNTGGGDVYSSITVPKQNTALVVKHSGTKCPPCGGWGWTAWEEIMAANAGSAHFVTAFDLNFVSELFITDVAEDWKKGLGVNSWPTFCAQYKKQTKTYQQDGNTYIDVTGTKTNVENAVNDHAGAAVVVNSGFKTSIDGNTMTVNIKTKFFEAAAGDYYYAVYITEDEVMGKQSGHPTPNSVAHEKVLRQCKDLSGTNLPSFGTLLATNGSADANLELKNEVKIALDPSWNKAHLNTHVVIWKKVGSKYEFVNMSR